MSPGAAAPIVSLIATSSAPSPRSRSVTSATRSFAISPS